MLRAVVCSLRRTKGAKKGRRGKEHKAIFLQLPATSRIDIHLEKLRARLTEQYRVSPRPLLFRAEKFADGGDSIKSSLFSLCRVTGAAEAPLKIIKNPREFLLLPTS